MMDDEWIETDNGNWVLRGTMALRLLFTGLALSGELSGMVRRTVRRAA